MRHGLGLVLTAAAAGVGDLIAALAAAVPVVAQGRGLFLDDFPADGAGVLGKPRIQAGGSGLAARHQHIVMLVGVRGKVGGQHHAAGIGVGGHRELDGGAAVGLAGAGGPPGKDEALGWYSRHGAGGAALLDELAGRARKAAAVGRHEFQRDLGPAHGDGIFRDEVGGHAVRGGDGAKRLRAAVLGYVGVGAHIVKVGRHRRLGQMHAVRKRVVGPGPAGGAVPQDLGAVQELEAVLLAHFYQRGVVGVHLGHRQVGVLPLLVQRGNGAHDDVAVRPRRLDRLQALQIGGDEARGVGGRTAQVVGAEADDDARGFEHGHRFGNGVHGRRTLELLTFQRGDGPGPHAHDADVVVQRCESLAGLVGIHHVPRGVGVADEQRPVHIAAARVGGLRQHGAHGGLLHGQVGGLGRRGAFGRSRFRGLGGFRCGVRLCGRAAAQRKEDQADHHDQNGGTACRDQIELPAAELPRQRKGWHFQRKHSPRTQYTTSYTIFPAGANEKRRKLRSARDFYNFFSRGGFFCVYPLDNSAGME